MITQTVTVPAANGTGTAVKYAGGYARLFFVGSDYDSGTITPKISIDGGTTYFSLEDTRGDAITATANAMFEIFAPEGVDLAMVLTGSSGSTAVTATLVYGQTNIENQGQKPA